MLVTFLGSRSRSAYPVRSRRAYLKRYLKEVNIYCAFFLIDLASDGPVIPIVTYYRKKSGQKYLFGIIKEMFPLMNPAELQSLPEEKIVNNFDNLLRVL